jgi:plasmid stabilization system protein ParE
MADKAVRFHPEAEQEYLAALSWYLERSLVAAANFENAIRLAVAAVRASPHRWPTYFKEFRKYTLRHFPFSVIYQEFSSEIMIFAVAHGSRQPGYWRSRE